MSVELQGELSLQYFFFDHLKHVTVKLAAHPQLIFAKYVQIGLRAFQLLQLFFRHLDQFFRSILNSLDLFLNLLATTM